MMPPETVLTDVDVVVTGGAGFIGSHVVDRLLAAGNRVTVIDDLSVGSWDNVAHHERDDRFRFIRADIGDVAALPGHLGDAEVVIHMAIACLRTSLAQPRKVHEINATGTLNVCQAALDTGVRRVVYVSSSESYGTASYVPMDEAHPLEPITVYGASKAAGELYTLAYGRTYGLETAVVRPFNSYGPREPHRGERAEVIPRFALMAMAGRAPVIFGTGTQTRDFTWVEDTAAGIVAAAGSDKLVGETVNVARGEEVSILRIAELVLEATDRTDLEPVLSDARPGDVDRHYADASKAAALLDWRPTIGIEDGIARYVTWLRDQNIDIEGWLASEKVRNW